MHITPLPTGEGPGVGLCGDVVGLYGGVIGLSTSYPDK